MQQTGIWPIYPLKNSQIVHKFAILWLILAKANAELPFCSKLTEKITPTTPTKQSEIIQWVFLRKLKISNFPPLFSAKMPPRKSAKLHNSSKRIKCRQRYFALCSRALTNCSSSRLQKQSTPTPTNTNFLH